MSFFLRERFFVSLLVIVSLLLSLSYLLVNISDPTSNALVSSDKLTIKEHFLIDQQKTFSVSQVLQKQMPEQSFAKVPWSFADRAYWLELDIENNSETRQNLVVHFDNAMLDELTIYNLSSDALIETKTLSWKKENDKILDKSILHYSLNIAPFMQHSLLMRIESNGISKTPINIYQDNDFVEVIRSTHLIWGAFIGILCMMALYNLVLFYGLKEEIYLIYIGYLTTILTLTSIVQGFGHYLFPSDIYRFFRVHIISLNFLCLAFALLFALFFLNFHKTKRKFFNYSLYFCYLLFGFAGLSIFLPENQSAPIFFVFMAITYGLCFYLLYVRYNTNQFWSVLYFISWVPLLVGAAIQPLELTNVIPYSFLIRNTFSVCILFEITLMAMALAERIRHQKELTLYNATHDLETNLPNFHALESCLEHHIQHQKDFTICLIKISGLDKLSPYLNYQQIKSIHSCFLDNTSQYLATNGEFINLHDPINNTTKKLARVNEDIFACLVRDNQDESKVKGLLYNLHQVITDAFSHNFMSVNLRTNISYYMVKDLQLTPSDLLKKTSQALNIANKDNIAINNYENHKHYSLTLASELKQALINNELMLFHQPQIRISNNTVYGCEALIRWNHPLHGYISPESLIALAEDTSLINELTTWVLKQACLDIQALVKQGYSQHNVSVNISGSDIADKNFLTNVKAILASTPIPPGLLSLELTESIMINDYEYLQNIMQGLDDLGISVSIDDFGTGYSSLSHILQLPFSELKIDRIFIKNIESNQRNLHIVKTTIDMAKVLNLTVVAEGIETKEEAQTLQQTQCDLVQGYYYAKPMLFEHYLTWLKARD